MTTAQHPAGSSIIESAAQGPVYRQVFWGQSQGADPALLLDREWLVTNGLGGYASGTIVGMPTRRYHGLLIAALPAPLGRTVMLNHLAEEVRLPGGVVVTIGSRPAADGQEAFPGEAVLDEFRLESGLPVWSYTIGSYRLERRILMPHRQNTVHVAYRLLGGEGRLRLRIRPAVDFRGHEMPIGAPPRPYVFTGNSHGIEIVTPDLPPLRLRLVAGNGSAIFDGGRQIQLSYTCERDRGYDWQGSLWSPGYFRTDLGAGDEATLIASTESWAGVEAIAPAAALQAERQRLVRLLESSHPAAHTGLGAHLVLAADQFIVVPATRVIDAVRSAAEGDEARTIIAGYHWFTDWGRDTMISLEGLTLITGRKIEAGYILRNFAHHVRDGLIPNLFPEGGHTGLYHTADATLWFFHAVDRYVALTDDRPTLRQLLPTLADIVHHHLQGTHFGIHVDPEDGLLSQGQLGYQLTWMDAKVGDWVVTPRRGKAVEINALWYNALRLMQRWIGEEQGDEAARPYASAADRAQESFNRRFWYPSGEHLYDVVDGEGGPDPALRPNQVFAISLPHPVLDPSRWRPVMDQVTRRLLTPMGLRSLAPGQRDYKPRYDGDLRSRDAAYHQGTVWAWLIGPFIDAWLKTYPENSAVAREFLAGFESHLGEACVGTISEVFDAEAPYLPRGCVAQAWSVAEVLRCYVKTAPAAAD